MTRTSGNQTYYWLRRYTIKVCCRRKIRNFVTKTLIIMETTNTIRIPKPSRELVAFIERAQRQKKERMKKICDKYRKLTNG